MSKVRYTEPPRPQAAVDFLEKKKVLKSIKYDDYKQGEHSHIFTAAHTNEKEIADDIKALLSKALKDGESYQTFYNNMYDLMKKTGWYGGAGHTEKDYKYINWRIRTIYDTNMRTAYQAQGYQKQLEVSQTRPIWVYHSLMFGNNRRQEHMELNGKAFRFDDPFWDVYHPQNGWGCQCYVTTESEAGAKSAGIEVCSSDADGNPPDIKGADGVFIDWETFVHKDWTYNPGKEAMAPDFSKYKDLSKSDLRAVKQNYHDTMEQSKMSYG